MVSANLVYKFASHDYELPERGEREKTNTFFFFFAELKTLAMLLVGPFSFLNLKN